MLVCRYAPPLKLKERKGLHGTRLILLSSKVFHLSLHKSVCVACTLSPLECGRWVFHYIFFCPCVIQNPRVFCKLKNVRLRLCHHALLALACLKSESKTFTPWQWNLRQKMEQLEGKKVSRFFEGFDLTFRKFFGVGYSMISNIQ